MEARSTQAAAAETQEEPVQLNRRRLMLRDGLTFLTLTVVALVLAAVTTLLFRTFESHREALAVEWAQRGQTALEQGRSDEAVRALRASLEYRPGDRENQLALARALEANGHTAEAETYFLNLWQAQPGDGPINLQLARLERSRGKAEAAINYYRAAVFGVWSGDAPVRRRDTRLELSRYLIERGQAEAAVAELLIAAGNNPDAATQLAIAEALEAARDAKDAFVAYRNAAAVEADRGVADAKAGELCYRMGDYACAANLLSTALQGKAWTDEQKDRMSTLRENAVRLQVLAFGKELPSAQRAAHLLDDAKLAQARMKSCAESHADAMQPLQEKWKALDTDKHRAALRQDGDLQEEFGALVFETEMTAAQACGAATGDDALLLHLHDQPETHVGAQGR